MSLSRIGYLKRSLAKVRNDRAQAANVVAVCDQHIVMFEAWLAQLLPQACPQCHGDGEVTIVRPNGRTQEMCIVCDGSGMGSVDGRANER